MAHITKSITYHIDGFEVPMEPADGFEPQVKVNGDTAIVVYAVAAEVGNPLEDMDGEGCIYHHPRSKYGRDDDGSGYLAALGMNQDGNQDLDAVSDDMGAAYQRHLLTTDLSAVLAVMIEHGDDDHPKTEDAVRQLLLGDVARINPDDHITQGDVAYSLCFELWSTTGWPEDLRDAVDKLLAPIPHDWQVLWETARAAGRIGNPYAVLLSCYEHGGVVWSIQGEGSNCRWDSNKGAAVWVPDDCAKENIELLIQQELDSRGGEWESLEQRDQVVVDVLHHYARPCVKMYSNWVNGSVYDVVVVRYVKDGSRWEQEDGYENAGTIYGCEAVNDAIIEALKETE